MSIGRTARHYSLQRSTNRKGWLFVLPAALLIAAMMFYPMIQTFVYSLQTGTGNSLSYSGHDSIGSLFRASESIGAAFSSLFTNYSRMFIDNTFKSAIENTVYYLFGLVPIMLITAMVLAVLLNDRGVKIRGIYRTCIFLPCATSLVSCSMIFKQLFANDGFVNTCLLNMNLISDPIPFLTSSALIKLVIIITMLWRWTGYNMIFYLAGLQSIDDGIYEAARIDGASAFRQFTSITVPLLKPSILMTTITSTNGILQLFDEVRTMTTAKPTSASITLSTYIYRLSFEGTPKFGYASAISYAILIIVAVLAYLQMRAGDSK